MTEPNHTPSEDEVLSREVAVSAKLEEHGIAVRARSRAVAALDRLVGSLIDVPAAFLEGVAGKKRLRDRIEERLRLAEAALAEGKLEMIPDAGLDLLRDVLRDQARKQVNATGVAVEMLEHLKAQPDHSAAVDNEESGSQDPRLDDDWMNQFSRYAEDATSDKLQQLWGRILSGEIQQSGSFSRHTLRFVAELDQETAQNCEICARALIKNFIPSSDHWKQGKPLTIALDMQRLGLLEGVAALGLRQQFVIDPSGSVSIQGRAFALMVEGSIGTKIEFEAMALTRMGREVLSLLDVGDERERLRDLASGITKSKLTKITLGTIERISREELFFRPAEILWTQST